MDLPFWGLRHPPRKDAVAYSATLFASKPTRRILRQIEAESVALDSSACAGRCSECVIRDRSRTNQPPKAVVFLTARFRMTRDESAP
jgi:hypothetical protein